MCRPDLDARWSADPKEQNTVLEPELGREMFCSMPAGELETALQGIEYVAKYARLLLRQRKRGHDE